MPLMRFKMALARRAGGGCIAAAGPRRDFGANCHFGALASSTKRRGTPSATYAAFRDPSASYKAVSNFM
jgi:hypothetical protein